MRFAKMYNSIIKGSNDKMILLCKISVFDRIKGIIGHNVELIRRSSGCSYDYLVYALAIDS